MDTNDGYINLNLIANPQIAGNLSFSKPAPMNITFSSPITGKKIGVFSEEDGLLSFDGDLDESGKLFVDFVCSSFNKRIQDIIKEAQGGNNDSI